MSTCFLCARIDASPSTVQQREDEIHNLQKQVLVLEDGLDQVHVELADVTNKLDTTEKQFFVVRLLRCGTFSFLV